MTDVRDPKIYSFKKLVGYFSLTQKSGKAFLSWNRGHTTIKGQIILSCALQSSKQFLSHGLSWLLNHVCILLAEQRAKKGHVLALSGKNQEVTRGDVVHFTSMRKPLAGISHMAIPNYKVLSSASNSSL